MKRIPSKTNFTILYHASFLIKLKFAIGFGAWISRNSCLSTFQRNSFWVAMSLKFWVQADCSTSRPDVWSLFWAPLFGISFWIPSLFLLKVPCFELHRIQYISAFWWECDNGICLEYIWYIRGQELGLGFVVFTQSYDSVTSSSET